MLVIGLDLFLIAAYTTTCVLRVHYIRKYGEYALGLKEMSPSLDVARYFMCICVIVSFVRLLMTLTIYPTVGPSTSCHSYDVLARRVMLADAATSNAGGRCCDL